MGWANHCCLFKLL